MLSFSLVHERISIADAPVARCIDRSGKLSSASLGILSPDTTCPTCRHGVDKCTGHAGWIKFFEPVWVDHLDAKLTWMPVPPLCVRPARMDDKGRVNPHDLTTLLQFVVRANAKKDSEQLKNAVHAYYRGASPHANRATQRALPVSNRMGRPMAALGPSLEKKTGLIRGVCLAKRVNFSARVVVTPDVSVRVDQVALPRWLCETLTVPVPVHQYIGVGLQLVDIKSICYVERDEFWIKPEWLAKEGVWLQEGDILHRYLQDGDLVVLNRQPTLWRSGMMAHSVVVRDCTSMGINPSVCKAYGADFDGDEMNVLVPQGPLEIKDARERMAVAFNLFSPRDGSLMVQPIQDTRTGLWIEGVVHPPLESYPPQAIPFVLQEQQERAASFLQSYGLSFRLCDVAPDDQLRGLSGPELEAKSVPETGNLSAMVRSGAKAKASHCMQMRAGLGQQYLDGAPNGPPIASSFWTGLNPSEFFLHSMSGREGSIDTAIKTATSGELYRALAFGLADVVRDASGAAVLQDGRIVSFAVAGEVGEAVGPRAAHALGEPCTQMSLSNFHLAGTRQTNLLQGMGRLKQLLFASRSKTAPEVRVTGAVSEAVKGALAAQGAVCVHVEGTCIFSGVRLAMVYRALGAGFTGRVECSDPWAVFEVCGIEAARACLLAQLAEVWATAGISVSRHHLSLVADVMCCTGRLTGFTLTGLRARGADPLTCAAFEETAKQFVQFGREQRVDPLRSVTACILTGKLVNVGSGYAAPCQSMQR